MKTKYIVKRLLETYDHAVLELSKSQSEKWKLYYLGRKSAVSDAIISSIRHSLLNLEEREDNEG